MISKSTMDKKKSAIIQFSCHVATRYKTEAQTRKIIEEQPVRIMVNGIALATLMHTPGNEIELTIGFLLTEGIVRSRKDISSVLFCKKGTLGTPGEILVYLADGVHLPKYGYRDIMSSCSLCGEIWMEAFIQGLVPFPERRHKVSIEDVLHLCNAMSEAQKIFARTGAAHCAAIAELPVEPGKKPPVIREDIGRHNALDKAVGAAIQSDIDLHRSLLFLSSRLSFEMVVKAAHAEISCIAGISAPSATAIRLAKKLNMFLAGFVRDEKMTIYAGLPLLH